MSDLVEMLEAIRLGAKYARCALTIDGRLDADWAASGRRFWLGMVDSAIALARFWRTLAVAS